jgi:hypothetical protein
MPWDEAANDEGAVQNPNTLITLIALYPGEGGLGYWDIGKLGNWEIGKLGSWGVGGGCMRKSNKDMGD